MKYPDDANGDALRRMEAQGDDLTRPRNVEFTFTSERDVEQDAKWNLSSMAILQQPTHPAPAKEYTCGGKVSVERPTR